MVTLISRYKDNVGDDFACWMKYEEQITNRSFIPISKETFESLDVAFPRFI